MLVLLSILCVFFCMPIVFVLAPVGGPTFSTPESSADRTQCGRDSLFHRPIRAKDCPEGAGRVVRDTRIGGARLLFTYRSRWPLFTFYRNGASSEQLRFICSDNGKVRSRIRRETKKVVSWNVFVIETNCNFPLEFRGFFFSSECR